MGAHLLYIDTTKYIELGRNIENIARTHNVKEPNIEDTCERKREEIQNTIYIFSMINLSYRTMYCE